MPKEHANKHQWNPVGSNDIIQETHRRQGKEQTSMKQDKQEKEIEKASMT